MMHVLERYVAPTLASLDAMAEGSDEYQQQKAKMTACVKNYLKDADPDKKEFVNLLLEFLQKEQELLAKDTFMRGFSLGALTTMEAYINRENYLGLQDPSPNPYLWGGKGTVRTSPPFVNLIINYLAEQRVEMMTFHPNDPLICNSEKKLRQHLEQAFFKKKLDGPSYYIFEAKLLAINVELLRLKSLRRFSFGYEMGETIIMDVFNGRDLLVSDIPK